MSKRHVLILMLAAILLTVFSVALSRRDSRDWRANRSRRLMPFPWQDTASVTITRHDGETVQLVRQPDNGEWRLTLKNGETDILSFGATEDLTALATLTQRDPLPDRAPPNPETAVSLVAANQAGQKIRLDFGDVKNNVRAVIVDEDPSVVYGVNQDLVSFLDWPEERLRTMYLASIGGGRAPDRITLVPNVQDSSLTVVLSDESGGWRQIQPMPWPVDDARLDLLLRWLDRFQADSIADDEPKNLEHYGLKPPVGYIETWYDTPEGGIKRRIDIGKENGAGGTYVKAASRNPVFVVPRESLAEISLIAGNNQLAAWKNFYRRRTIDLIGEKTPVLFRVEQLLPEQAVLTMRKTDGGATPAWQGMLEDDLGSRSFSIDPPDAAHPLLPLQGLVNSMSSLRVKSFLADEAPGDGTKQWTRYPAWRVSCRFSDGGESPVLTIYAANASGDFPFGGLYTPGSLDQKIPAPLPGFPEHSGFAFSLSTQPGVMEAYSNGAYQLCLPPYRYQSRRILDARSHEFMKAVIKTKDGETVYFRQPGDENDQWWKNPASPEPLTDDNNRFAAVLEKISQLSSEGFVSDGNGDMSEFGLDQPEITAIVYSSPASSGMEVEDQGRLFELSLGKKAAGPGGHYARLDGNGPVFLLTERFADALEASYR